MDLSCVLHSYHINIPIPSARPECIANPVIKETIDDTTIYVYYENWYTNKHVTFPATLPHLCVAGAITLTYYLLSSN